MHRAALAAAFVLVCLAFASLAQAEPQVYKHTIRQAFGGAQSPDSARAAALARAKREVLEQAGTYLESLTVVREGRLSQDETLALAAGVLRTEIVKEENYVDGDSFGIAVTARVEVDPSALEERVRKLLGDRQAWERVKELEARERELLEQVAQLEEENRKLMAGDAPLSSRETLQEELKVAGQKLTAVDYGLAAGAFWVDGEYSDPQRALTLLSKAIELDPNYAMAYNNRGLAYDALGQHQRAIKDYDRAVELEPKNADAYINRGGAYCALGQHHRAIQDLDRAIELDPKLAMAYSNRGIGYAGLGQHHRAIQDYDRAVELDPNYAMAYNNRGSTYAYRGQLQQAIQDYTRAIELDPGYAMAYFNRGRTYADLGQPHRAIQDYDRAIELDPKDAAAYYNRGIAYALLGEMPQACRDAQTACRLGKCKPLELLRQKSLCR